MKRSGDSWSLEYDDGVVIGRFREGMPLSAFETGAYPAFEAICEQHSKDIVGTADLVELDDALGTEVLDIWEQAAQESSQLPNYRRGALVADGITELSLKNKLRVPDAEIKGFENLNDAIAWARSEE